MVTSRNGGERTFDARFRFGAPSKNFQFPWSFAPDGKRLAFDEHSPGTGLDLWTVPRAGKPEVFLQTPAIERTASFSPDGWLAYTSDESGTSQTYVRAFPDKGGKWQVSNSNGIHPAWSRNGHELFSRLWIITSWRRIR